MRMAQFCRQVTHLLMTGDVMIVLRHEDRILVALMQISSIFFAVAA